jgi:DNA replication protein DnaC
MEDGEQELYTPHLEVPPVNLGKQETWDAFVENHKKYRNVSLDGLHEQLAVAKYGYEAMLKAKDYRGIRIFGPPGVGKTYALFAIIKDLIFHKNMKQINFEYVSEEDFFANIKASFGYNNSSQIQDQLLKRYKTVDVVFYDDMGAASKTVSGDWGKQVLMEIFNTRYKEEKTTFVTSNLSLEEISLLISPRIADRLNDMHSVQISGKSLRSEWKNQT